MEMPVWMPVIIYATVLMAYLGVYAWRHMDDGIGRRPFVMLVFLTAFMLVTDLFSRCFVYEDFPHLMVVACTCITFLMMPAIGAEWYQYVRSVLTAEERTSSRFLDSIVNLIAAVGIIVLMASPVTRWVYYFDDAGMYYRGDLFIVPAVCMFLIMVITEIFLLVRVQSLGRHAVFTLLTFILPPIIGASLAMVVDDVPWIPLGISISMVILFSNILTTGMSTDYLTGAYNRKRLEELMSDNAERAQAGHRFAAIMVDVDNFKRINDTLGHAVGDVALADTARMLKNCVRAGDAVARFGGDEFFVLLDVDTEEELEDVVNRLREEEAAFNAGDHLYTLRLSKGYAFFDPEHFENIQQFEEHLDNLMYTNKQHHKAPADGTSPQSNRRNV